MNEIAGMFFGIGFCILMGMIAYFFYQLIRGIKVDTDYDERLFALKGLLMNRIAKTKDIDLEKEVVKGKITLRPSFRRKMEKKIIEEMFGKESSEEKK